MTDAQRIDNLLLRLDILIAGLRRTQEELRDRTDMKRTICKCGAFTRFDVCPECFTKRLREDVWEKR